MQKNKEMYFCDDNITSTKFTKDEIIYKIKRNFFNRQVKSR